MIRLLKCKKDAYVTDKIINGRRMIDANTGQAGTLDLFKLYDETDGFPEEIELSRLLLQFDLDPVRELIDEGVLSLSDSSFQCFLSLKDVYGGQTTPSNFTLRISPISGSWDEGRGSDILSFRDHDATNWLTASVNPLSPWTTAGGDIWPSPVVSSSFAVGNEDLFVEITPIVSSSLSGQISDHGVMISFVEIQESDEVTRFVKRFGSRHSKQTHLRPQVLLKYNDTVRDDTAKAFLGTQQDLFLYNSVQGEFSNFFSGSTEVSGTNCMSLELTANKWVKYWTTSFSPSHSASINHLTRSMEEFTRQFEVSSIPNRPGFYSASVLLDPTQDPALNDFLSGSKEVRFQPFWKSLDESYVFRTGSKIEFRRDTGTGNTISGRRLLVNVPNLRNKHSIGEKVRLRVAVQDFEDFTKPTRDLDRVRKSIQTNMRWRLVEAFTKKVVVPFDSATTLSYDAEGNYFDFWFSDLYPENTYEFQFLITRNGKDLLADDQGFVFKVGQ